VISKEPSSSELCYAAITTERLFPPVLFEGWAKPGVGFAASVLALEFYGMCGKLLSETLWL
jgi:hypothetical protein